MSARDDAFEAWQQRARDADILDVALNRCAAKLSGRGRERVGSCPRCGGEDRFSINTQKQVFNCRGAAGGDVVAMVMHCAAVPYLAACEIVIGEEPPARGTQLTPEARAAAEKARALSAERAARREADNAWYRDRERQKTRDMWERAHPLVGSSAAEYLALRGLAFPDTPEGRDRLKCIEDMPYWNGTDKAEPIHRGPAMVAPIVDASRKFRGLHFTYLDLSQPKGKLQLADPDKPGAFLDAKKARGSKHGNRVELIGPREPLMLVLGEGIEKVLAVWRALQWRADRVEATIKGIDYVAFWSACDLGNLAGKATDSVRHPTLKHEKSGRALNIAGATPDLAGPAIAIPDSVTELVLLGDSTSDPFTTQLAMCRAAARYARPRRLVRVAWAPAGNDFDDLWRLAGDDAARAQVAERICAIVQSAAPPVMPEIEAAARAGDSRQQRAAAVSPQPTGAGDAGAPNRIIGDELWEWRNGLPPPAAAAAVDNSGDSSRSGGMRPGNAARSADRTQWSGPPRKYGDGEDALDRWLATFPLTDLGNVERFVHRQRGRLIYCPAFGWFWWDGRRWSREGADGRATIAEHETVRAIQREAQAIEGTDQDIIVGGTEKEPIYLSDRLAAWGRTSENASRLNPISKRAAPSLAVEPHELDADPFKFNLRNGTLVIRRVFTDADGDWRSWERVSTSIRIKPHDPADLITKASPVLFDARAVCPIYDGFMNLVQPSAANQRFIDDFDGYSMTGDATEQVLVFHHGTGKNGKTTQIAAKLHIVGDYGRSIPIDTFAQEGRARQAGQATPDLAMLHRVRYLSTSEPQKNWRLDEALIKVLTGGDEVPVRELHKPYFMLRPEFKLGMNGNYRPRIDGGEKESGIWRRVKLVPWSVKIPAEQRDKHFGDRLKAEASGILNRMLRGLERWMEHGLVDAPDVAAATEQFRQDSDPLGRFLEFCTKPNIDGRVQTTLLYQVFQAWTKSFGEAEWKPNGFGRAMTERGFLSKKSDLNYWLGIELVKGVNDFVDHQGNPVVLTDTTAGAGSNEQPEAGNTAPARRSGRHELVGDEHDGF